MNKNNDLNVFVVDKVIRDAMTGNDDEIEEIGMFDFTDSDFEFIDSLIEPEIEKLYHIDPYRVTLSFMHKEFEAPDWLLNTLFPYYTMDKKGDNK